MGHLKLGPKRNRNSHIHILLGSAFTLTILSTVCMHQSLLVQHERYSYADIIASFPGFASRDDVDSNIQTYNSSLRFDWTNVPPVTPLGRTLERAQSLCLNATYIEDHGPMQVYTTEMRHSGMGSSLHLWMDPLCHAATNDRILFTDSPWLWNDQELCPEIMNRQTQLSSDKTRPQTPSALSCYFGHHESGLRCPPGTIDWDKSQPVPPGWCRHPEQRVVGEIGRGISLAGVVEWIFQNVSRVVIDEAERQIREAFPLPNSTSFDETVSSSWFLKWPGLPPPESLITVHIRWGDKAIEMELASIEELINATKSLMDEQELSGSKKVHIYVASEDPAGLEQFIAASASNWIIHASGPKNTVAKQTMTIAGSETKGKTGLESIAALLISMQSNRYVLTRASNWSRLIDELRKNVVDPRCGNCTRMINLRRGEY